ncbi:MAG: hypothetical protein H8D22_02565 [Candidatus Cloacimonetes bacterium]|nr:hypothetical protein [Candidatus Cloacimonadota bacterium]
MIDFIIFHQLGILRVLNLVFWFYVYKKSDITELNRKTVKYFVHFLALFTIWNILMIVSEYSGRVYLFFWVIISIYEFYLVITILFKLAGWDYSRLAVVIPALPIVLGAILSLKYKNYQPINTVGFFNALILVICSVLILWHLLLKKSFIKNIETFFIFSGFILYFGLHILASNIISFGFLRNWVFGQNATLIGLIYWLGSIICIRKIRYKYSS